MPSIHKGQRFLRVVGRGDIKTPAMILAKPESFDGHAMLLCSISLVAVPTVMREFGMQSLHVLVPPGLGEDTGGRDGCKERIALYNAPVRCALVFGEPVAVDQQETGF